MHGRVGPPQYGRAYPPIPPEGKCPRLERGGFRQPSASTAPPHKVRLDQPCGAIWWTEPRIPGATDPRCWERGTDPDPVITPSLADLAAGRAVCLPQLPAQSFPRLDKPGQRGEKRVLSRKPLEAPVAQGSCQLARPCPSPGPLSASPWLSGQLPPEPLLDKALSHLSRGHESKGWVRLNLPEKQLGPHSARAGQGISSVVGRTTCGEIWW